MKKTILEENESRRLDLPVWMLVCFSMFCVWQMGSIYFMGSSLVLDDRTPLPIDTGNVTTLIALGYVLSILWMIAFPHLVVWATRVSACAALVSVLGLFLPLRNETLTLLLYAQTFFCCFMIGFEIFIICNLFTEDTAVRHLTAAYAVAMVLIAVVQNDLFPFSFPAFRLLTLGMLVMLLVFLFRLPAERNAVPRFVRKGDDLQSPKWLVLGICAYSFVADIMMLGGPAAVAEIPNGVFLAYLADAAGALVLYILYRRKHAYPLLTVSVLMSLSVVGFLMLFLSSHIPALTYPACVLVGFGFLPSHFMGLYGLIIMNRYPSRFVVPGIMGMALLTVLVHSTLVESFRSAPNMLHLAYLAITVICILIYLQIVPFFAHTLQHGHTEPVVPSAEDESVAPAVPPAADDDINSGSLLTQLTARERQVLDLIGYGYSNRDIARMLVISDHTVNDYTKKIYRKLNVHSRHAAAQIVNKYM